MKSILGKAIYLRKSGKRVFSILFLVFLVSSVFGQKARPIKDPSDTPFFFENNYHIQRIYNCWNSPIGQSLIQPTTGFADSIGRVWVATNHAPHLVSVYQEDKDKWVIFGNKQTVFPRLKYIDAPLPKMSGVQTIAQSGDGRVWFSTDFTMSGENYENYVVS